METRLSKDEKLYSKEDVLKMVLGFSDTTHLYIQEYLWGLAKDIYFLPRNGKLPTSWESVEKVDSVESLPETLLQLKASWQ